MLSVKRIAGVVLRHLRLFDEINRLIWTFYWPLIDMFLFGLTSIWMQQQTPMNNDLSLSMIMGVVFWQIVNRASVEASVDLLEEIWSLNMLNLFATPLRLAEWIIAIVILAFFLAAIVTIYCSLVVWFLFSSPVLWILAKCFPFLIALFISGLWLGFFGCAMITYFGARVQWIPWMLSALFMPFCSALYPITILPVWAQKIAWGIPMTAAFEGIRNTVQTGTVNQFYLVTSLLMALSYCALSLLLLAYFFDASKQRGFARLTAD